MCRVAHIKLQRGSVVLSVEIPVGESVDRWYEYGIKDRWYDYEIKVGDPG